jgi:23S rRNA-/tRNA-specific pseudouridylate synthase
MKVSAPGGRDRVCCVSHNVPGSLEASTRYRVLLESAGVEGMESPKHLSPFDGQHVSLVALWPTQGRTHQLRVHCAQRLGEVVGSGGARRGGGHCFIIGDSKYGPKNFLHFALSSKDSPAPETNKEHDAHVKHSSGRSSPVGKCLDVGRTDSPTGGRNTTSQRIRLCLHALKIRVMLPADAQAGQARACVTSGWREVECVAQLPDHILTTAAKLGINDLDVHDALRPYLRKGTTDH